MKEEVPYQLPEGWVWTTIKEISLPVERTSKFYENFEQQFKYIDIESINNATSSIRETKILSWRNAPSRAQQIVKTSDILFSTVRPYLRNNALIPKQHDNSIASTGFCVVRPVIVNPGFIFHYMNSQEFITSISRYAKGTSYPAVTNDTVLSQMIPIPPLEEQLFIVDKIEELFSEILEAEGSLKRVIQKIEIYKHSALSHAFNGNLTKEWRKLNRKNGNKEYLKEIKSFKSKLYLSRLKEWEQNKNNKRKPVFETDLFMTNKKELPKLPIGWLWSPLGNISNIIRGASPRPAGDSRFFGGKVPWITVGEITKDESVFLNSVSSFLTDLGKAESRFIEKGNLLITNSGATLGVPKINLIDGCINDGSVAILDLMDSNLRLYLYWFLKSKTGELRKINQGAGQPNLNTDIIKNILIPIPSLAETIQVVEEIEERFTIVENLKKSINTTLTHINTFRTAVLKKAFSGKLGSFKINTEPVNDLIIKIKETKDAFFAKQKLEGKNNPKKKKFMNEKKTVLQILQAAKSPLSAKDVWLQSKHKDDIEGFYSELRELQNKITEIKKDTESLLTLRHENR